LEVAVILLRVPATLAYRELALQAVVTGCRAAGWPEHDVDGEPLEANVISAFAEAFNNIARHAYASGQAGDVTISVGWSHDELVIETTDTGRSFDLSGVPLPDFDALPESGMGVFIMRSLMDEVVDRPGPPNVLRLVKRRPATKRRPREVVQSGFRIKAVVSSDAASQEGASSAGAEGDVSSKAPRRHARGGSYSLVIGSSKRR
jgi:serine/threonine-protein kinase RsbW